MMNSQRRLQKFRAWSMMIRSMGKAKVRNKFHEHDRAWNCQGDERAFLSTESDHDQLSAEIEAWEAASDDDFEAFEQSLG
jgi:hypothetical protein